MPEQREREEILKKKMHSLKCNFNFVNFTGKTNFFSRLVHKFYCNFNISIDSKDVLNTFSKFKQISKILQSFVWHSIILREKSKKKIWVFSVNFLGNNWKNAGSINIVQIGEGVQKLCHHFSPNSETFSKNIQMKKFYFQINLIHLHFFFCNFREKNASPSSKKAWPSMTSSTIKTYCYTTELSNPPFHFEACQIYFSNCYTWFSKHKNCLLGSLLIKMLQDSASRVGLVAFYKVQRWARPRVEIQSCPKFKEKTRRPNFKNFLLKKWNYWRSENHKAYLKSFVKL